ncbi:MAG: galactokinase family protein, partial [Clostridia bacterium]|nr:galactokinase family protein [Clostridia bacterium]
MPFDKIFESNNFKTICRDLYGEYNDEIVKTYQGLVDMHVKELGFEPEEFYSASGRIEIVGNHTDHNAGKVLCA